MRFELLPILDKMLELYKMPPNMERFNAYLKLLSGDSNNDLVTPVGAYNPMAKEHVTEKINELKALKAEQIASQVLNELNTKISVKNNDIFKVVLCVSDDLKGGWTNRYTSDYDSKFKLNALVTRNFCTPLFWTSENYSEETVIERTKEYGYRTIYWLDHPKPITLEDHVKQEAFVAQKSTSKKGSLSRELNLFYQTHKNSDTYLTIFNFLYGDKAMEALGNGPLGIKEDFSGFEFAKHLSNS